MFLMFYALFLRSSGSLKPRQEPRILNNVDKIRQHYFTGPLGS